MYLYFITILFFFAIKPSLYFFEEICYNSNVIIK